ncbi:ScbR family autoregulator-binding transcription factor [Streptomyces sp. TRM64462]|uniref:ScbR family autoregulator-binding transcription factor n=1 Tax=Streptomyces sp. TRM64462 TaxID=2741726 RepID=UPI0028167A32|nr:ScbR family autoregulator-binding transcription factor [Streptomyces sp. TRM64462]
MRTRAALIRSAAEAFQRRGYGDATVAEIAAGAGVSTGALHFHFDNKGVVARAVVETAGESLRDAVRRLRERRVPALQVLVDMTHAFAVLFRDDVVVRAGFRLSGDHEALNEGPPLREEWHTCVEALCRRAAAGDELAEGVTYRTAARFVASSTAGVELLGRENEEWLTPAGLTDFWRLALPALARPGAEKELRPDGDAEVLPVGEGLGAPAH